jgi:hypothetical protein
MQIKVLALLESKQKHSIGTRFVFYTRLNNKPKYGHLLHWSFV